MKNTYIDTLSFLKLGAVLGILACHTGMIDAFDACARMVEILFLVSGFLMAYNHHQEKQTSTGWQIVVHKLPRFYPIHVLCFLLQLFFVATWTYKPLSYHLSVGVLNLSLLQAWFIGTEFSYNNVSWYLSALVFAYAMTPVLKKIIQSQENKSYGLLKVFLGFALTRLYLEYFSHHASRFAPIDLHCNPLVQTLNYSLGYVLGVLYQRKNIFNKALQQDVSANYITVAQFLITVFYILICICFYDFSRFFFILAALPVIYMFAINRGLFKWLSSLKAIRFFENMTLEIFMLHSFILYKIPTDNSEPLSYVKFFIVTIIAATICHLTFQKLAQLYNNKKEH